jgi:hypothetical protein
MNTFFIKRTIMKTLFTFILSLSVLFAFSQRQENNKPFQANGPGNPGTISVTGLDGVGLTADNLVTMLVGPGISFSNVSFTGTQGGTGTASGGSFTNGLSILGVDQGIILSSGLVNNAPGDNTSDGISASLGLPGDADLDAAFGGITTFDATVLEFDFIPTADQMYVQYVFGSDEYNEYVGQFNDPFAFFLDGVNIALVPGTSDPVSVGNVNLGTNSIYYHNNDPTDFFPVFPYDIEADGFTSVFTATGSVTANQTHHIKLVIADRNDHALDSWVFLKAASFSTTPPPPTCIPTLSEWGLIILALLLMAAGLVYIRRRQYSFATAGEADVTQHKTSLFNRRSYFIILSVLLGIAMMIFVAETILSINVPARDIVGSLVSSAILAYILQLIIPSRNE